MIRGMLPRDKPSGKSALQRLRAYMGVPHDLTSLKKTQFDDAKIRKSAANYITYGRACQNCRVDKIATKH